MSALSGNIVVLFVDAFSYQHISRAVTPFLATQKVKRLTPVLGFRQLAAAFGCPDPLATGFFADHWFAPSETSYPRLRHVPLPVLALLDQLPRLAVDAFSRYVLHHQHSLKRIPLAMARFFATDSSPYPDSAPVVRLLRGGGLTHRFVLHPDVKDNDDALRLLKEIAQRGDAPQFLLLHFPSLDPVGHRHGLDAEPVRILLRQVDDAIRCAVDMFESCQVVVFSDHGMVNVTGLVDVLGRVDGVGRMGEDFVVFLDSTMARFWILNERVRPAITRALCEEPAGRLISPGEHGLHGRCGDLLFLASPGNIVYPNFFDAEPPRGMHGYATTPGSRTALDGILYTHNVAETGLREAPVMADVAILLQQAIQRL